VPDKSFFAPAGYALRVSNIRSKVNELVLVARMGAGHASNEDGFAGGDEFE
jgi:hypothetical protein